jgi:hypothetical protein
MSDFLTHEGLVENLNTKFHVSADGATIVDLDLAEVSELKIAANQEQFSLIFRGPRDRFLGQGTRSLEHEKLGQSDLFLVPVREDAEGYYYEAVFNRFLK